MQRIALIVSTTLCLLVLNAPPALAVAPTITSFAPSSGPVGTSVVITGTGFTGAPEVRFNGTLAVVMTVDSDTQITATVPVGATTGPIAVTNPDGTATSTTSFTVTTSSTAPNITSFTPSSGPVGTLVVITGTGFTGTTAVRFNATPAIVFTVSSATQITATVPTGATTGPIAVTTPDGTDTSTTSFTVATSSAALPDITDFSPRRGPVGTLVTVQGRNFADVVDVRLNDRSVAHSLLSGSAVSFRVPPRARSGHITVVTQAGTDSTNVIFRVLRDRHSSLVEITLGSHLVASGTVRATDGERTCRSHRLVTIQRRVGDAWRGVATDLTWAKGTFRVKLPDRLGRYRAVVRKKATIRDVCSRDRSFARSHIHVARAEADASTGVVPSLGAPAGGHRQRRAPI